MLENYDYILSLDIETYSPEDLPKCGVYKYAAHPEARILWLACELLEIKTGKRNPVTKFDLMKHNFPEAVIKLIKDPKVAKFAWNANFERTFLSARLGFTVGPEHWFCTMVLAARAGYPMSLDVAAKAMGVENQKSAAGKALINYFCKPCAPTKANGGRTRNMPGDAPQKWEEFGEYCAQDVRAESDIRDRLLKIPVSEFETRLWHLDQQINDRGVMVDTGFIRNAIRIHEAYVDDLKIEAAGITGLDNPNSRDQLIAWLRENELEVDTLRKADVAKLIKEVSEGSVKRMLEIRSEVNKTSVKKYSAMINCVGTDDRIRGLAQFYGASRTGRWAGRLLQYQNLPQNHLRIDKKNGIDDLDVARKTVEAGDGAMLDMLYSNVPDTLSQLIRTAIVPVQGHRFVVSDYAAIEARVLAWIAGEQWLIDLFAEGKRDIYIETIARMLGLPYESIDKNTPEGSALRQRGKVSVLSGGYQGGINAYIRMGALEKGIREDELQGIVDGYRNANKYIVSFWYAMQEAAIEAIKNPGVRVYVTQRIDRIPVRTVPDLTFKMIGRNLYMFLPSGRMLSYVNARYEINRYGNYGITYMGMDQTTKRWTVQDTYGGKLTENCLSGDTLVLTDTHGWIKLTEVTTAMKLWDGQEWVNHDGVVYKGDKEVMWVNGVQITEDHKVLTNIGWQSAEYCNYEYSDWTGPDETTRYGRLFTSTNRNRALKVYDIMNAGPRHRFSVRATGYTPFIVHNCVQAVARDCLAEAMINLDKAGYPIVMTVHDEVVLEVPIGVGSADEVSAIMGIVPDWATGLPLKAESFETMYYKKE